MIEKDNLVERLKDCIEATGEYKNITRIDFGVEAMDRLKLDSLPKFMGSVVVYDWEDRIRNTFLGIPFMDTEEMPRNHIHVHTKDKIIVGVIL